MGDLALGWSCTLSLPSIAICERSGVNRRIFSGPEMGINALIGFGAFGAKFARGQVLFVRFCSDVLPCASIAASVLKRAAKLDFDLGMSDAAAAAKSASLTTLSTDEILGRLVVVAYVFRLE